MPVTRRASSRDRGDGRSGRAPAPRSSPRRAGTSASARSAPGPQASARSVDRRRWTRATVAGPSASGSPARRGRARGGCVGSPGPRASGASVRRRSSGAVERVGRGGHRARSDTVSQGFVANAPKPPESRHPCYGPARRATPQSRRERGAHRPARHGRRPRSGRFEGPQPHSTSRTPISSIESRSRRLSRGTAMTIQPLDPGARSAGTLDQGSTLVEPALRTEPPQAPVRRAQPRPTAGSVSKNPWRHDPNISWYGPGLYGNGTACGQKLTKDLVGVAHRTLPCGTLVTFRYKGVTADRAGHRSRPVRAAVGPGT